MTTVHPGAFIAGEWHAGEGELIEVHSPWDDSLVGSVNAASSAQLEAAVKAAADAFPAWRRTPLMTRVDICRHAFEVCERRNPEIAEMITRETGKRKPRASARSDRALCNPTECPAPWKA